MKISIRSKAAALAGRLSETVDAVGRAVAEAVRDAAFGLGTSPGPLLVPVRVRVRDAAGRR